MSLRKTGLAVIGVLLVAIVAFWAGHTTLVPPQSESFSTEVSTVEVTKGELGRTITVMTSVERDTVPLVANQIAGTVTHIGDLSAVSQGGILYKVNDVPVRAVVSQTPFWRALTVGSTGDDVQALNRCLSDLGYGTNPESASFTQVTAAALRSWQKSLGMAQTGEAAFGELVAVAENGQSLVAKSDALYVGASMQGGEKLLSVSSGSPSFVIHTSEAQAKLIPTGTILRVHAGDKTWEGVAGEARASQDVAIPVTAADGGLLCGQECAAVPSGQNVTLFTDVIISNKAAGLIVPLAAIHTDAQGKAHVIVVDGENLVETDVKVVTIANGLAVVEGVAEGQRVQVSGATPSSPAESSSPDENSSHEGS
ncbi:peptidoglycan-binding domain-containing protein [Trueperella sp. LYQ141]|uniref:peptidoglycan-binding domain-containing protein n=1 Tax=Trueperella sp. LYQ141 TaxID=3391058 RepID=UPI003983C826